jgi:hypothetical protein
MTAKTVIRRIGLNVDFGTCQRPVLSEVKEYFRRNGKEFKCNSEDFALLIRALDVCPTTIHLPGNNLNYFLEVYGRVYGVHKPADIPEEALISMLQYLLQRGLRDFNETAHQAEEKYYSEVCGKAIRQEGITIKTTEITVLNEELSRRLQTLRKYEKALKEIEPETTQ